MRTYCHLYCIVREQTNTANKMNRFLVTGVVISILISFVACEEFKLNTDDLNLVITLDQVETHIDVKLIDAATQTIIGESGGADIQIVLTGRDAQLVVNSAGEHQMVYQPNLGIVAFGFDKKDVQPSEDNPVKLTIVAKVKGYLSSSYQAVIAEKGTHSLDIQMVSYDNPQSGVEILTQDNFTELENGRIIEEINITTGSGAVEFKIPTDTKMFDASGNPLSGKLSAKLAYFDPTDDRALESFPGGLDASVTNESGESQDGYFVSAGLIALEIVDENGRSASQFEDGSLQLTTIIPSDIINPETGSLVAAGDEIGLWSYEDINGEWTWESTAVFESSANGLIAKASISHLSYWNFDWHRGNCQNKYIHFTGDETYGPEMIVKMYAKFDSPWVRSSRKWIAPGTSIRLANIPIQDIELSFTNVSTCPDGPPQPYLLPETVNWHFCENGDLSLVLKNNPDYVAGSISETLVKVILTCSGTGTKFRRNYGLVRYRESGSNCSAWEYVWISNGQYKVNGNTTYEFQVYYKGFYPSTPYILEVGSEEEMIISQEFDCGG